MLKRALLRAAAVAALCAVIGLLTRGGSTSPKLMWLLTTVQLVAVAISAPAVAVLRGFGLTSGDYLGNHDLAILTFLNLVFYTGLFYVLGRRPEPVREDPSRRAFLARGTALVGGVALVGVAGRDKENLEVVRQGVALPGLPSEMRGMRLAVIADLHRGPYNSMDFLARVMDTVTAERPDLVLLPGDFVQISGEYFADAAELVARLRPRIGLLGTLGNHDHWEGLHLARTLLPQAGLRLLDNDRVFLTANGGLVDEAPARGLCLGGVGDLWEDRTDLAAALRDAPADMPRLLLSHNPDFVETGPLTTGALRARVDLQISGHTHGGQVNVPGVGVPFVPSRFGNRYSAGLVQGPAWPVYVNRGIGTTILPLRLRVRPEITLFTLT